MLSIRALSRSVSRCLPARTAVATRSLSTLRSSPLLLRSKPLTAPATAPFNSRILPSALFSSPFSSSARVAAEKEGEVDLELAAKLESELSLENETNPTELPETLEAFLSTSSFSIVDNPGTEEVTLTKTFGDEQIKVVFSVSDLTNLAEEDEFDEDPAMFGEEEDGSDVLEPVQSSKKNIGTAGATAQSKLAPQGEESAELIDEGAEDDLEVPSFPARLSVTISKQSQANKLLIEAVAQDGMILVDNVLHLDATTSEDGLTAETDETPYTGPQFSNLDEDLQLLVERYLDERGINTELALFIPDYIDWKEQREYVSWLKNIKTFVEA